MPHTPRLLALAAALSASALLAGCAGGASGPASGEDGDPVRIGVVGASDPYWETYIDAAADAGIEVEIVDFSDYQQPNPALGEGELDLNQFQHLVFLAQYNVAAGDDLVPIGATAIYPLALYSTQYDSVDDIPEGATIAIPNDESNQARALLVLQSAGLLTLEDGGGALSTPDDIVTEESRVTVTPIEASLTPTSLPDVAGAIINNDFVEDAGLTADDALAKDDPSDPSAVPYVNVFAARADDADNEVFAELVEIFQSTQAVLDGVQETSGGTAVFATTPPSDLQAALDDVQADIEAQG